MDFSGAYSSSMDWHTEVAYVYEVLCRETAGTPLLANLTLRDFIQFCEAHSPGMRGSL